jgi:hypothetical protein
LESTECSAYPACSALDGECCPTIDNVILDCCFSIADLTPAPSAVEDDSAAPSSEVEDTTASTPAPSAVEDDSAAPSDLPVSTPAPSLAEEETSSAPTETATTVPGPPQSTPPADTLVSVTPLEYEGCIEDEGNVSIDKIFLRTCDSTKLEQKFKYDGALMHTGSNEDKCLQAGYNGDPAEGEFVRVVDCDSNNSLQKFTWDFANSGFISLTDKPDFCMSFRGVNDNVGADPILIKECELNDFEGTKFFRWGVKA